MNNKINKAGKKIIAAYNSYFSEAIPEEVKEYIKDNIMKSESLNNDAIFGSYDPDKFETLVYRNLRYRKTDKEICDEAREDFIKWAEDDDIPIAVYVDCEKKTIIARHMVGKKIQELRAKTLGLPSVENVVFSDEFIDKIAESYGAIYAYEILQDFFSMFGVPIEGIVMKFSKPYISNRGYVNIDLNFEFSIEKSYDDDIRDWIAEATKKIMLLK